MVLGVETIAGWEQRKAKVTNWEPSKRAGGSQPGSGSHEGGE